MMNSLISDAIESMEWMVEHMKWAHDQTGLGGSYSPELLKAIETLEKLKELKATYDLPGIEVGEFLLTQEEWKEILVLGFPPRSPQKAINDFWVRMGEKYGFDCRTIKSNGKMDGSFLAIRKRKV